MRAKLAFAQASGSTSQRASQYANLTRELVNLGLYQSAGYFFIRTLQLEDAKATRRVLDLTESIVFRMGPDLLGRYLKRHTTSKNYDSGSRSVFFYINGKEELLRGRYQKAISQLNRVSSSNSFWPLALQLRGTAKTLLGRGREAIEDFKECADVVSQLGSREEGESERDRLDRQSEDLKARCLAGIARVHYELGEFREAERAYDDVPKASFVWTDILLEQAWNAYALRGFNRSLGKLVSYKSPDLSFFHSPEIEVLSAQSFLRLCLFEDANLAINAFNNKYRDLGSQMKRFIDRDSKRTRRSYERGKEALSAPIHSKNLMNRVMNRFVRSPYFVSLVQAEEAISKEKSTLSKLEEGSESTGLTGFLRQVLGWRLKSIRILGGNFVRNSMIDHYNDFVVMLEKLQLIKLEVLSQSREELIAERKKQKGRLRGGKLPQREGDQFYWDFNGEYWIDELGDYVFGLKSQCKKRS